MFIAADYPFLDVFWTMLIFVMWVIWIWIVVAVLMDLFRRQDVSGWGKAAWAFFVIGQGKGMADRKAAELQAGRAAFDDRVRSVSASNGAAGEIAEAKKLLDSGAINEAEFEKLKRL